MRPHAKLPALLSLGFLLPLLGACRAYNPSFESHMDSTVVLDSSGGQELGVSTEYGIVFLGLGQRSGEVGFTAWFQDGPSLETGVIEPLGGQLFMTRAEIQLPTTPLSFLVPPPGTQVLVSGREAGQRFSFPALIAKDTHIDGLLLEPSSALDALGAAQAGAGIYLEVEGSWKLLGLLSGHLEIQGEGSTRSYYTLAGPDRLWRLAAAARDLDQPKLLPKRGDILP